jgi:hypothetical protein
MNVADSLTHYTPSVPPHVSSVTSMTNSIFKHVLILNRQTFIICSLLGDYTAS